MDPLFPAAAQSVYGTMDPEKGKKDASKNVVEYPKLGKWTLMVILYFNVSGGPFMSEDTVVVAGPLFAILGFLGIALFYATPAALLTAELATTYPEDAGVVAWVTAAFGPKWGVTEGLLFWLYGAISMAPYPLMLLDYIKYVVCPDVGIAQVHGAHHCEIVDTSLLPFLPNNGVLFVILFVLANSYLSWKGVEVVGAAAIGFVAFVLLPFVVMCLWALPRVDPSKWFITKPFEAKPGSSVDWLGLLQALFWCMNYWDSASTTAGETENPQQNIPTALMYTIVAATCTYILPIMVCTAALPDQTWFTGFWVQAGYEIGGHVLQYWILVAGMVSISAQFLAGHTSVAYEVYGMAELGQMPKVFLTRNSNGVPIWSLVLSTLMVLLVLAVSNMSLAIPVAMSNGVYCAAELVTYVTFLYLRWNHDTLHRPFRIPLGFVGCLMMLVIPTIISVIILGEPFVRGNWVVAGGIFVVLSIGLLWHSVTTWLRGRYPDSFLDERQSQSRQAESGALEDTVVGGQMHRCPHVAHCSSASGG